MQDLINFQDNYVQFDFQNKPGQKIKIIGTFDDPYFCGKDVCAILEYSSARKALQDHVKPKHKKDLQTIIDEVSTVSVPTPKIGSPSIKPSYNDGKAVYVSEPGLYALIMKSRTSFAETFQDFVYEQILPSIRKKGRFQLEQQLQHQAQVIEQNQQQLEQKDQQLEQKDQLLLRLNEMLIDSTALPKTQVVYIATSPNYAQQNRFKVGGVEKLSKLKSRLAVYNSRSANGDVFYFSDWYLVHNYKEIETRLKDLLGRFRDNKAKEIYVLHYTKLKYILKYLIDNYNEETDVVNNHLVDFISSLDSNQLRPVVPKKKCLKSIKISEVGHPDIEIEGNTNQEIEQKLKQYFQRLNIDTTSVTSKTVFDELGVKKKRLELFKMLTEIGNKIRPDVIIKKR